MSRPASPVITRRRPAVSETGRPLRQSGCSGAAARKSIVGRMIQTEVPARTADQSQTTKGVIMIHDETTGTGMPDPEPPGRAGSRALLTGRSAAAHINRRLDSRDWWLLVTCERHGTAFLAHLERTYYAGQANKDFEMILLPALHEGFGVVCLFMAKKGRMPADRLCQEITDNVGPISVQELRTLDVLFPHPDGATAAALARFVVDFLARRSRQEDN